NLQGGTFQLGAANAISSNSAVSLANVAGATLNLNNFNDTIFSLSGGGTTGGNVTLGSGTLTTGDSNATTTFAGVISGTGAITKIGSQFLVFNNTADDYTGGLTINAGTVTIESNNSLGSTSSTTTVNSTGVLNFQLGGGNYTSANPVILNNGGKIESTFN